MKLRSSRVLKLLRDGQLPTVLKINLSDPRVIEIAGLSNVDVRRTVFSRRQEDPNPKPILIQDRWHRTITYQLGYCQNANGPEAQWCHRTSAAIHVLSP